MLKVRIWAGMPIMGFALVLLGTPLGMPGKAEAGIDPHIFNTVETAALTKWDVKNPMIFGWRDMEGRWHNGAPCSAAAAPTCTSSGWQQMIDGLKGKDRKAQVEAVNTYFNNDLHPYRFDQDNWGRPDYYATPYEFLKKSGDCEDYAIAKYMALRALGVPVEDMRLLGVSIKSQRNIAHAILLVALNGETVVLDNRNAHVMRASLVADYRALISVNEINWRLHLQK